MTEERKDYMRRYNEAHKEELAEKRRKYYEENKEKFRENARRYYARHKDIVKVRVAVSRERKAMNRIETPESPELSADIRKRIFGDHSEIKSATIFETPESPQLPVEMRKQIEKEQKK